MHHNYSPQITGGKKKLLHILGLSKQKSLMLHSNNIIQQHSPGDAVITAVAVDQPTLYYSVKFKETTNSSEPDVFESGINVEAFRFLRDALHFTEKALKSRGQMKPNDNDEVVNEGIVEVLNSDMADIAISLYDLLPYRMAGPYGVRFLHAVFKTSKAVAVFTQPPKNSTRNLYGRPFESLVWYTIFGLIILTGALYIIFLAVTVKKYNNVAKISMIHVYSSVKLLMICIATRQGFYEASTATSVRIITILKLPIIVCFISSVVFHSLFSSALTSIFTIDFQPVSSFDQLVKKQYKLYYDKYVPSIENIVEDISMGGISVVEMGKSIGDIIRKAAPEIFRSKAVILTTVDRYYPLLKRDYDDGFLCSKLATVPLPAGFVRTANFVKQGSQYRDHFNRKLLLMLQSGLIERLYTEHNIRTSLSCFESGDSQIATLDLFDTAFPFLIIFFASLVAIVILLFEMILKMVIRGKVQKAIIMYIS